MATYNNVTVTGRPALKPGPLQPLGTGTITTTPNADGTVKVELAITSGTLAGFDQSVNAGSYSCGPQAETLQYAGTHTGLTFIAGLALVVPSLEQINAVAGFVVLTNKGIPYLAEANSGF